MSKTFYITTPIFYPNAKLHMGHAYTVTLCDIICRAQKIQGKEGYLLTGADENTGKILKVVEEQGQSVEEYLSQVTENFKDLYSKLGISYNQFIKTSDKEKHWPGAQALWKKLVDAGDIYKASYTGLYCVGCETFYTEKDLADGKCPVHLTAPEQIKEENYFFRLSKYTQVIKEKIESDELLVLPQTRKNEILALLERGLEDISFSRPVKNVPHGIPVPGDNSQVIYVWCDALVNYISALGYGRDDELFQKFWPADVHVVGKDILRFHAAIWPAMLLSAGISLPKSLLVHGLITSGGHKMSKSLGNVIDPYELIEEYGYEAVRYYLAREVSPFEDGDMTTERFKESYNANLANGIGNLTSRIMKMAQDNLDAPIVITEEKNMSEYFALYDTYEISKAGDYVWNEIKFLDQYIQEHQPFKLIKTDKEAGQKMISDLVARLHRVALMLAPILPETSEKIKTLIKENKVPETQLFVRKD
ncbi:MAG: class I tRNA ligase family protein [Candidatus Zambryskibacteria bacterium]|nr:class I tRNA ligase family protein [Candidatus Zambryskibacteria bacterium]